MVEKNNKDIFFVSYANLPISGYLESPPMASIEQYPGKQGRKAAEILMQLMDAPEDQQPAPQNILIDGELVEHKR